MTPRTPQAVLAMQCYHECDTLIEVFSRFMREHHGKIEELRKHKLKKGVGETILFKFPDLSKLKLTKFIMLDGRVNISIKKVE